MTEEQTAEALLSLSMPPEWTTTRTGALDVTWARWSDNHVDALVTAKAAAPGQVEVAGCGCSVHVPLAEARAAFDHVVAWIDRPYLLPA